MFNFMNKRKESYNYGYDWAELDEFQARNIDLEDIGKYSKFNSSDGLTFEEQQGPLYYAIKYSSTDAIFALNIPPAIINYQCFNLAIKNTRYDVVDYLMSHGADISLSWIANTEEFSDFEQIFERIIKNTSISQEDLSETLGSVLGYHKWKKGEPESTGYRPTIPDINVHDEEVRYRKAIFLLDKGANPNYFRGDDWEYSDDVIIKNTNTPFHEAVQEERGYQIITLLLDRGGDVNIDDAFGKSVLDYLVSYADIDLIKLSSKSASKKTLNKALVYACMKADISIEILNFLVKQGADVNSSIQFFTGNIMTTYIDYSPAKAAILTKPINCDVVKFLSENGAKFEDSYKVGTSILDEEVISKDVLSRCM